LAAMRRRVLPPRSGEGLRPVPFPRGGPRRRRGSPPSLPRRALRPASPFPATRGPLAPSLPRSGRPFRRPVLRRGCWPRRPRVRWSWGLCPRPEASPAGAKPPSPATPSRPRFGGGGSAPSSPGHCLLSRLPGSRQIKTYYQSGRPPTSLSRVSFRPLVCSCPPTQPARPCGVPLAEGYGARPRDKTNPSAGDYAPALTTFGVRAPTRPSSLLCGILAVRGELRG